MVKRLTTFVIATSPTFWLNEVIGRQPKSEDSELMKPSQQMEPEVYFSVASQPRPDAASAEVSPMVSVADTRKIRMVEKIASARNSIWNGISCGIAMIEVPAREEKSTMLCVHALDDGERLELISEVTDDPSALLEALLNRDADALDRAAGLCDDGQEALQRTSVCEEIVDDQDMILWAQELLRYDHLVLTLMGEGLHLCGIDIAIDIEALGLLREHHRYMKVVRYDAGNADAGSFDGENLIDRLPFETAFRKLTDCAILIKV